MNHPQEIAATNAVKKNCGCKDGVGTTSARCYCSWKFLDTLCKVFVILFKKRRGGDPCVYIPGHIINRPDPCIYSQFLLMKLNQPVTWDNPDIALFLNGVEQYTYDLVVNTEYDVVVTVRNTSREKPANGTRTEIRWIEFGAGAQITHPIDTVMTNVPVWPGNSQVTTKWRTPATPGHYCLEVELFHPEDGNPSNNKGWNNTQVKVAASEVRTEVRIFNQHLNGCPAENTPRKENRMALFMLYGLFGLALAGGWLFLNKDTPMDLSFKILLAFLGFMAGYLAGLGIHGPSARNKNEDYGKGKIPCNLVQITLDSYNFNDRIGKEADPDLMFAQRPPAWPARVEPALFHFAPNETYRDVLLIVDAPDYSEVPENFNVSVMQGGFPTGGVTVTVLTKNLK